MTKIGVVWCLKWKEDHCKFIRDNVFIFKYHNLMMIMYKYALKSNFHFLGQMIEILSNEIIIDFSVFIIYTEYAKCLKIYNLRVKIDYIHFILIIQI